MRPARVSLIVAFLLAAGRVKADAGAGVEHFEHAVRPLLVEHCIQCHGPAKQKGGLRLDSRAALLAGGDTGPALVPGKPGDSLLVNVVRYHDDLKMPPKGKLPDAAADALAKWVTDGAPWPDSGPATAGKSVGEIDWAARERHWSLLPIRVTPPPVVTRPDWAWTPIDAFILAKLEQSGLSPAPDAETAARLRRLSQTLTGLPPAPDAIEKFGASFDRETWRRQIEVHLASPGYGERWGRHWLDLVRFAETYGHEFDVDIPDAWRYRDYVIRAMREDVPYDRLVREHVAGDLLPDPRRRADGSNESIVGTGFWFLHEAKHSPVDVTLDGDERLDNQIDVFGKAFLGMTLACARCHDHKFDAIRAADYYALSGILQSSRFQRATLNPQSQWEPAVRAAAEARRVLPPPALSQLSANAGDPWAARLFDARTDPAKLAAVRADMRRVAGLWAEWRARSPLVANFREHDFAGWNASGPALGDGPTRVPEWRLAPGGALSAVDRGWAHSGRNAPRLTGQLRSPTFAVEKPFLVHEVAGDGSTVNLVIDNFQLIREPIYGPLTFGLDNAERPRWVAQSVAMWRGTRGYSEYLDDGPGWFAVREVRQSDTPPPAVPEPHAALFDTDPAALAPCPAPSAPREWLAADAAVPNATRALAMLDGTPENDRVHVRGSHKSLGAEVPRRGVQCLDGPAGIAGPGTGRLELARRLTRPDHPLTARVIVNRVWHHHFGTGLVPTTDDFGVQGQLPSHPELLDWLADWFVREGWSLKKLHRLILSSHVYHTSSSADTDALRVDPTNRLLARMPVRRLEAESIRDALLALSGRLQADDPGGPGVPPHLTEDMIGRGRPSRSGPLDGDGRRSVYLTVRRNFPHPMLAAFDLPTPFTAIGRRTVSNVPAQALTMLNNPFVAQQSELWANRVCREVPDPAARVARMYRDAYGRPPTDAEAAAARAFVAEGGGEAAWSDLAHVLVNVKEFLYVP